MNDIDRYHIEVGVVELPQVEGGEGCHPAREPWEAGEGGQAAVQVQEKRWKRERKGSVKSLS